MLHMEVALVPKPAGFLEPTSACAACLQRLSDGRPVAISLRQRFRR